MIFLVETKSMRATATAIQSVACGNASVGLAASASPSGMTLLEVLVACGILVFALSGIAAILPAAGSRLAESVAEDRAALLAANIYGDLTGSEFLSHSLFATSANTAAFPGFLLTGNGSGANARQLRTLAMGVGVTGILDLNTADSAASKVAAGHFFDQFHTSAGTVPLPPLSAALNQKWPYSALLAIEARREFFIQDEIEFAGDGLKSKYESNALGPRAFKGRVCWGATLAASGTTTAPGSPAVLTIAIFKQPGQVRGIDLTQLNEGVPLYTLPAGFETTRSAFLRPCNYVLVLPPEVAGGSIPRPPKWFRVDSSWTVQSPNAANRLSYVLLPQETCDYTTSTGSGKQLLVIGFTGLIRVDQHPVTLN